MTKRQRKQYLLVPLTDSNFADDIAFLSNTTQAANRLLQRVEEKVKLLRLNERHSKQSAWFSSNNTSLKIIRDLKKHWRFSIFGILETEYKKMQHENRFSVVSFE